MRYWNLLSGGPCDDEPEKYHELEVIDVAWYWLFLEWMWNGARDLLGHIPLPGWPTYRASWPNKVGYICTSLADYYGDLGGVMQSVGDPIWQKIVRHTLGDGPRVRVSCAFFNAAPGGGQPCTCGYEPRAPEKLPPRWEMGPETSTSSGGSVTQIPMRYVSP